MLPSSDVATAVTARHQGCEFQASAADLCLPYLSTPNLTPRHANSSSMYHSLARAATTMWRLNACDVTPGGVRLHGNTTTALVSQRPIPGKTLWWAYG